MNSSVEVKIYKNPKKVSKAAAKELVKIIQKTNQPAFHIALSGGNTPKMFYQMLVTKHQDTLPWRKIHFWWGDERCVPPGDPESNYKLAHDNLLSKVPVPGENIHRIKGENSPEAEAIRYAKEMEAHLNTRGTRPVFDLIILGLGNDGHTASIFPGYTALFHAETSCAVTNHPTTGQKRITLTGNVLNNANQIFVLVTGKRKALRVSDIMNDDEQAKQLPAYSLHPDQGKLIWFFDENAASLIS
jgi:6-phosphogluconolactonase